MATAVMVERNSGSFSMVHMSASASLIRFSNLICSVTASASHPVGGLVQGEDLVLGGVAVEIGAKPWCRHARAPAALGVGGGLRLDVDEVRRVQVNRERRVVIRWPDEDAVGRR